MGYVRAAPAGDDPARPRDGVTMNHATDLKQTDRLPGIGGPPLQARPLNGWGVRCVTRGYQAWWGGRPSALASALFRGEGVKLYGTNSMSALYFGAVLMFWSMKSSWPQAPHLSGFSTKLKAVKSEPPAFFHSRILAM